MQEQKTAFNRAMAQARATTADAERVVTLAQQEATRLEASLQAVPGKVGFLKRLWWHLTQHFDAKAYYQEQAATAGIRG